MNETVFEVTACETGNTFELTRAECEEHFGVEEFEEIVQGYHPSIVAVEI